MKKNNSVTVGKKQTTNRKMQHNRYGAQQLGVEELRRCLEGRGEWFYVGIDVGSRKSFCCFLDESGQVVAEITVPTDRASFTAYFTAVPKSTMAVEVGTASGWMSELLQGLGHDVVVANARKLKAIWSNRRKNDETDAQMLARLLRADRELLFPIRHRRRETREELTLLRAREAHVSARTQLINSARGLAKSHGVTLIRCSAEAFSRKVVEGIPESLKTALIPLVESVRDLTLRIRGYDRQISRLAQRYPETEALRQVAGVGELVSVAYRLTIDEPERFRKSREVGPYLGLVPRQDESGEMSRQLRITKTGDKMMRQLLVTSAHYILSSRGPDTDLKRHGLQIAERGGKNAKKRAVVAVARKLAVLLHRLWVTGEVYEPLRNSNRTGTAAA